MKKERNKIFRNLRYLGLVCVGVIGLMCIVATGGGDEEDGASVDTSLPLGLNAANAPGVSGLVFDTAEGGFTAASIGSNAFVSADSPGAGGFTLNVLRVIGEVLNQILAMEPQGWQSLGGVRAIPIPPTPVSCNPSGSIALNVVTDNPPVDELTNGDFIILTHTGCSQQGLVLDGEVTVGISSVVGDPPIPVSQLTFRLNFNSLTATDGGSVVSVFGTLDVTVSFQAGGTVIADLSTELSGGGSSLLDFSEGDDFSRLTLFTISFTEDAVGDFTLIATGTLESSYIGGTVTFETPVVPLSGTDFDTNDPSGGELVITGAGNAKVRLRVLNGTNVDLDLDLDGNGSYETTINTTWAALDAASNAL